ncbi:MAG: hypothetical protein ABUL62_01480 [Myxococcales bacterium]
MIAQATPEFLYRLAAFAVNAFSIAVYVRGRPQFDAPVLRALRRAANIARALSLFGLLGLYLKWMGAAGGMSGDPSQTARLSADHPPSPRWVLAIVAVGVLPSLLALLARSKARQS